MDNTGINIDTTNYFLNTLRSFFSETILDNNLFYIILILAITYIIAYITKYILQYIYKKVLLKTDNKLDDEIFEIIEKPIFKSVIFIGIVFGLFLFLNNYFFWPILFKILVSFFTFVWSLTILSIIKAILVYITESKVTVIKEDTLPLFQNLIFIIFYILSIYIILSVVWGVDATALIASLGVAGMAVGFAAKDTIADIFAGMQILTDKPYKIGDYVRLDSGERGKVRRIGIRSTRILTRSDVEITIPNSLVVKSKITNESAGTSKKTRVSVDIGVAYGTDIKKIEKILLKVAEKEDYALDTPEPRVRFRKFGASSLDFSLLFWIKEPSQKGLSIHSVNSAIYNAFNKNNIEIPYAKQDLYIKEFPKIKK